MSSGKTSQISMEYMMIIGFTTLLIITIIIISASYSKDVKESVNLNQLDQVVKSIIESAESVYYFGEPSKTTLRIFIPDRVQQVVFENKTIVFKVQTSSGVTDVGYKAAVPLNGTIPVSSGYHYLSIEAKDEYVWINST